MSTLGTLKARIRADIFREDLDQQIGESIDDAIRHYQRRRFYFNEVRGQDFQTVAETVRYADGTIPEFVQLDAVLYVRQGGDVTEIRRTDATEFEYLTSTLSARGEPLQYAYYARQIGLYPIPDRAYTVRLSGHIKVPAPASDTEADNPWMTDAFELVRCRAKAYLFAHHLQDPGLAQIYKGMELEELPALVSETARRVMYDGFRKTSF